MLFLPLHTDSNPLPPLSDCEDIRDRLGAAFRPGVHLILVYGRAVTVFCDAEVQNETI